MSEKATWLAAVCRILGWDGGTVHDAKRELRVREEKLIRMFNWMDDETDMQVLRGVEEDIAVLQWFQTHCPI